MYNSNFYLNLNKEDIEIKKAINTLKSTGAVLFLSVLSEDEVYAYVYRELSVITKRSVIEFLAGINRVLAA